MRPPKLLAILSAAMLSLLSVGSIASAATDEQVEEAIEKARTWLLAQQNAEGNWESVPAPLAKPGLDDLEGHRWGSSTSLVVNSLMPPGGWFDPRKLERAKKFLQTANIESVYGLGLTSEFGRLLPERERGPLPKHTRDMLMAATHMPHGAEPAGPADGLFGYWIGGPGVPNNSVFVPNAPIAGTPQPPDQVDLPSSLSAVVGLVALDAVGQPVPQQWWRMIRSAWQRTQLPNGGWERVKGAGATVADTAAGTYVLIVTNDFIASSNPGDCVGALQDPAIEAGLKWLDKHPQELHSDPHTMWLVKQLAVEMGRRRFGDVDWYSEGADSLVQSQQQNGSWNASGSEPSLITTCYALRFLRLGGQVPYASRLSYAAGSSGIESWNERPRDMRNFGRWLGPQMCYFELPYRIVSLSDRTSDLLETPLLYVSGKDALAFTPAELERLRTYVEGGGILAGHADCASVSFSVSFRKLGQTLFPKYGWQPLAEKDLLHEWDRKSRKHPDLEVLDNGVRHLMLLVPNADPGRAWQTRSDVTRRDLFLVGANECVYAGGGNWRFLQRHKSCWIEPDPAIKAVLQLAIARLDVGGNPDPEPGSWRRLAAIFHNEDKIDFQVRLVAPNALRFARIAHLTGTEKFQLNPQDRLEIKKFVDGGGTLIVDAAGGSTDFADAATSELEQIFGKDATKELEHTLPRDSEVYNLARAKLGNVAYRPFAKGEARGPRMHDPSVRGFSIGGRIAVFFSREDLSAGMAGAQADGIEGYDPDSATRLMKAIILYAISDHPGPAQASGR